eukprot:gnl/MRDRNA2_/MRDRNA2_35957_c0_seq1.p1 gnl/MRDRNA2_/MRDRNA2_35957_c0~~gnl/MRDRNA2_/MRDRNA2_35957_c0_seq1.p1  ORF type:complete len:324 (-),score=57.42 gnl/MRDRNA2_/MRDRNA2_35957_c0_seq1:108-1079(-)
MKRCIIAISALKNRMSKVSNPHLGSLEDTVVGKVDPAGMAARRTCPRAHRIAAVQSSTARRCMATLANKAPGGVTLFTAKSVFPAFNGWKLTITLEELREAGLIPEGFTVRELNLEALEHKQPWFLEINPNGRIPALIDHERSNFSVFESGAMMLYLAETRGLGVLLPKDLEERYRVLQWLFFQVSGIGPIQGQAHAFLRYVPEDVPYAKDRFVGETRRLYNVLNTALSKSRFVAGERYSIADISLFPWVAYHEWAGQTLDDLPHLRRWCDDIKVRPAVQRGLDYNRKDVKELLRNAEEVRDAVGSSTLDKTSPQQPQAQKNE